MYPIMPESSALWLVKNTKVTDKQIADFTGLHILIVGKMRKFPKEYKLGSCNPVISGELLLSNILECEEDPKQSLKLITYETNTYDNIRVDVRAPSEKKLNGVKWVVDRMPVTQICDMFYNDVARFFNLSALIVQQVMNRTHRKSKNLIAIHPVENKIISAKCLKEIMDKYNLQ